jgi:hypothetical protein
MDKFTPFSAPKKNGGTAIPVVRRLQAAEKLKLMALVSASPKREIVVWHWNSE